MQTLKIIEGTKAQSIANKIVREFKSQSILTIQAIGSNAINETISGIAKAKRILSNSYIHLDIKPVFPELVAQDELTTVITFQIRTEPLFIEVDS